MCSTPLRYQPRPRLRCPRTQSTSMLSLFIAAFKIVNRQTVASKFVPMASRKKQPLTEATVRKSDSRQPLTPQWQPVSTKILAQSMHAWLCFSNTGGMCVRKFTANFRHCSNRRSTTSHIVLRLPRQQPVRGITTVHIVSHELKPTQGLV